MGCKNVEYKRFLRKETNGKVEYGLTGNFTNVVKKVGNKNKTAQDLIDEVL